MVTKNIKINFADLSYDSSSVFNITSNAGDSVTGITYNQLTSTSSGYDFSVDDTTTSITVTCTNGVCANETASATFSAVVVPTATPVIPPTATPVTPVPEDNPPTATPVTPTPVVNDPTPTPVVNDPTPTPVPEPGITWYSFTGTTIESTDAGACSAAKNSTTYYHTESLAAGTQLYSAESIGSQITTSGRMVTGTTLYNIPNGVIGAAGSCPTYYTHTVYVSAPAASQGNLCNDDYTIVSSKTVQTTSSGFTLSALLNEQLYSGGTPWSPPSSGTNFYAVDTVNTGSTKDGSTHHFIEVTDTGYVNNVGTFLCSTDTPTPTDPSANPNTPTPTPDPTGGGVITATRPPQEI